MFALICVNNENVAQEMISTLSDMGIDRENYCGKNLRKYLRILSYDQLLSNASRIRIEQLEEAVDSNAILIYFTKNYREKGYRKNILWNEPVSIIGL